MGYELSDPALIERNARVVLKALLTGVPVMLDGRELVLDNRGRLCQRIHGEQGDEKLLVIDPSLEWFLRAMERIPDETYVSIAANVGLNTIRQERDTDQFHGRLTD